MSYSKKDAPTRFCFDSEALPERDRFAADTHRPVFGLRVEPIHRAEESIHGVADPDRPTDEPPFHPGFRQEFSRPVLPLIDAERGGRGRAGRA